MIALLYYDYFDHIVTDSSPFEDPGLHTRCIYFALTVS